MENLADNKITTFLDSSELHNSKALFWVGDKVSVCGIFGAAIDAKHYFIVDPIKCQKIWKN